MKYLGFLMLPLEIIPAPKEGYSVEYPKPVLGSAKAYLRPLQTKLDTATTDSPKVKLNCSYM